MRKDETQIHPASGFLESLGVQGWRLLPPGPLGEGRQCPPITLFIYLWLHWVFVAARGLSLVAVSGGYSSLRCMGSRVHGLQ